MAFMSAIYLKSCKFLVSNLIITSIKDYKFYLIDKGQLKPNVAPFSSLLFSAHIFPS
jgi:hypothetical protein